MAEVIPQPAAELEDDAIPAARQLLFHKEGTAVICTISVRVKGEALPRHAKFDVADVPGSGTTKTAKNHLLACWAYGLTQLGVVTQ